MLTKKLFCDSIMLKVTREKEKLYENYTQINYYSIDAYKCCVA